MATVWPGCMLCSLGLLEVGGDPEISERDDGEEVLAELRLPPTWTFFLLTMPVVGAVIMRVAEVELGLIDTGLGLLDVGESGVGVGLLEP